MKDRTSARQPKAERTEEFGRDDWIRTSDPLTPSRTACDERLRRKNLTNNQLTRGNVVETVGREDRNTKGSPAAYVAPKLASCSCVSRILALPNSHSRGG